jgi:hypothetical protein
MPLTSCPGATEREPRRRHARGSVFLDALFALLIGTVALATAMGGLALALRIAGQRWQQALVLVEQRNAREPQRPVLFTGSR